MSFSCVCVCKFAIASVMVSVRSACACIPIRFARCRSLWRSTSGESGTKAGVQPRERLSLHAGHYEYWHLSP